MRFLSALRLRPGRKVAVRHLGAMLFEVGLVGLGIATLEAVGRLALDDAADVVGVLLFLLLGAAVAGAARAGRAPLARRAFQAASRRARALGRRLEPLAGIAFRLPEDPPPEPWMPRRGTLLALALLLVPALGFAGRIPAALEALKTQVAYTPYVAALVVLWGAFGLVTTLGLLALRGEIGPAPVPSAARARRWIPWLVLWCGAIVLLAALPGAVPLASFPVVALASGAVLRRRPPRTYWLWRRDASGRVRAAAVHVWLATTWLATVLLLALVVVLAQAPRVDAAVPPSGRFGITTGLGLAATAAAFVLLVYAGRHLRRLLAPPGGPPEQGLDRTIWWPGRPTPAPAWVALAEQRGGWVVAGGRRPPRGHDLVVDGPDGFEALAPPSADLSPDEALFRLDRRLHVVMRRRFFRPFQALHREITRPPRAPGAGYLFCPHAWPVVAVIRDTTERDGEERAVLGGTHVGRPYAAVFPPRVRRYMADVLRALDVDLIYWEERVGWAPLRAVFGVLFETYDMRRFPLLERHFVGLARVSVTLQEPQDVDEALPDPVGATGPTPLPLRARILVIRKDDRGRPIDAPDRTPSTHRPQPIGV